MRRGRSSRPAFGDVQNRVAIAIGIQEVNCAIAIGINGVKSNARRRVTTDHSRIEVIIQAIAIGINEVHRADATGRDETLRRLSFHIVRDAVIVAVDVEAIYDAVTIGVQRSNQNVVKDRSASAGGRGCKPDDRIVTGCYKGH